MNRYPTHSLPSPDTIPPWGRVLLYVLAMLAPFVGLLLGHIGVEETLATVVALVGVVGPVVATVHETKTARDHGAHFRAGYGAAVAEHVEGSQAVVVPDSALANRHRDEGGEK